MMFCFENILPITGDVYFADFLEKLAYNVLPTQHNDDFTRKQYFQQANQVLITDETRNFFNDNRGRLVYGTTTGYPCCLANMHQGWPKFVQNMWYATSDNGLAALVYGASKVTAKVAGGEEVTITEKTDYPFKEKIEFSFETSRKINFPFHLRIPEWCKNPVLIINGKKEDIYAENNILIINREWSSDDMVELMLPMDFIYSYWHENSLGIERWPLVYALRVEEEWREVSKDGYDDTFWEVYPKSPWNYALLENEIENLQVEFKDTISSNPWNLQNAPLSVNVKVQRLPTWKLENGSAGKIPVRPQNFSIKTPEEEVTLIPYGCSTLRISQFPVIPSMK